MKLFFRALFLTYRLATSLRRRLPRRFTPAGLSIFAGFGMTTMMAVDTDNNSDYQAFALLFFLLLVAGLFTLFFRGRFSASRLLPRFATVGVPVEYKVRVRNLGAKAQNGLVLMEDLTDSRPTFQEWFATQRAQQRSTPSFRLTRHRLSPFRSAEAKPSTIPGLPAKGEAEVTVKLVPVRRGVLRFNGVTVARPDPLGLCRAFRKVRLPGSMLVLPKRYILPRLAMPGDLKYQQGGVAQASHVGQSEEFVSLRDYRNGDPLRHIHWRSWARVGRPVVKEFEDEFFVRHALVLDTFIEDEHGGPFEEAVSVAASFACTVQTQESLLDLLFVGAQTHVLTSGRGLAHADQLLEVLACVRPCRDKPFGVLESLVLNHVHAVSGCVLVLVEWEHARQELVRKLRALGVPLRVLVLVPGGTAKRVEPGPMADQLDRFHVLAADDAERGLLSMQ